MAKIKSRYSEPTDLSAMIAKEVNPPPISDISVARLIDDGLQALYREMRNLLIASSKGKLDPASSRDLRDTIKLLFEIQARENMSLQGLTDEQLKEKVKGLDGIAD